MGKNAFVSKYLNKTYHLPNFVTASPHFKDYFLKEIEIVKSDDGKWGVEYEGGKRPVEFDYDTFFEAYYDIEHRWDSCIWFSDDIAHEVFGVSEDGKGECDSGNSNIADIFFGRKVKAGYRMISRHQGDYQVLNLVSEYEDWLAKHERINEGSFTVNNIVEVFDWLNTHPDFWIEKRMGDRFSWVTDAGITSIWARPVKVDPETHCALESYDPGYYYKPFVNEWWVEGRFHI